MSVHKLFLWVYCLPIPQLIVLVLFAAVVLTAIHHRLQHRRWWNTVLALLLLCGSFLIVWQTVLSRTPSHFQPPILMPFQSYQQVLQGGNSELLRSNFMNILLFFPLGLCAGLLLSRWNASGWKILLIGICFCGLSCAIEYAQIRYGLGLGEVDDILHNTLGALLGALVAEYCPKLLRHIQHLMKQN